MTEGVLAILETSLSLAVQWWWVIAPIVLFLVFAELWLSWRRDVYAENITWVLLHISVPQEVAKSPLAMEQIFANMHSVQSKGSWWKRNIQGRVQEWFSLELVSVSGSVFFFIRTPEQYRNLVESAVYAQYPDAEITEADDYINAVPKELPDDELDLFGSEFKLATDNPYPIRTYEEFRFETKEGEADVDPLAHLMESLGRLRSGEQVWIQMAAQPVDDSWKKDGEKILKEITERKEKKKGASAAQLLLDEAGYYLRNLPRAPFTDIAENVEAKGEGEKQQFRFLAEHENEQAKAVARKISKVGFHTTIRGVYIAPRDLFNVNTYFSVVSGFRQFTSQTSNGLRPTDVTKSNWPLKNRRALVKKRALIRKYRGREPRDEKIILNTEELASIFHFPGSVVETPTLPRVQTRKGKPPAGLPVL